MTATKVEDYSGAVDGAGFKSSMVEKKLPLGLIPVSMLRLIAAVLRYGATKYAPNNWRRGMSWSEVYDALQRHLTAWLDGEWLDPETGLSHLGHAGCCLAFLIEYETHAHLYGRFDDRFKRPAPGDRREETIPQGRGV